MYRKYDLCCILHGFLFPLHTHSHTSLDDSYNCKDRKSTKSLGQEGGGTREGGLKTTGMDHSRSGGSFSSFVPSPY